MIFEEGFRRHVEGGSHIVLGFEVELRFDGKAEICDFPVGFGLNNVGGFQISMEDVLGDEIFVSLDEVMDDFDAGVFGKFILFGEVTGEIPISTIFSNDETFVFRSENIITSNNVRVVQLWH